VFADKYSIREINESIVLEQIISEKQISRASLSQKINLNKATISDIIKKLLDSNFIAEVGIGESTNAGGRKPILLQFNKYAGVSLSIDIGYDYISSMLTYLDGDIITTKKEDNVKITSKNVLILVKKIVQEYSQLKIETTYGIIGIAIAIHGIVHENKILFTPYYDLDKMDLYKNLSKEINFPIYLENEANLTALAESTFSTNHQNLVSISIHSGVGAGVIINDKLYHGHNGKSGEIGHTILFPNGLPCPCGNKGCLEQYCSEKVILDSYAKKIGRESISTNDLQIAYDNGDAIAKELIQEVSMYLAIGINNIISFYAPEIIYLNGVIISKIPDIISLIQEQLVGSSNKKIPIYGSNIGCNATLLGASSINIKNFLKIKYLKLANHEAKKED
jgi:predicted NBD/HSP70 family sugar kinase